MATLEFSRLDATLSTGLGLDQASSDLFSVALAKEWGIYYRLAILCYEEDPAQLRLELGYLLKKLNDFEGYFIQKEAYERCASCRDLYRELSVKYKKYLSKLAGPDTGSP